MDGTYRYNVTEGISSSPIYRDASVSERVGLASYAASVILQTIKNGWPVLTATSLAGFRAEVESGIWSIVNPVDYTRFVHSNRGTQTPLVDRLQQAGLLKALAGLEGQLRWIRSQQGIARAKVSRGELGQRAALARKANALRRAADVVGPRFEVVAIRQGVSTQTVATLRAMVAREELRRAVDLLNRIGFYAQAREMEQYARTVGNA